MSAHHLTVAKASFAAGLLRPDITKIGREDLIMFHTLLEAAISTCTGRNIQKCKDWVAANIAPSQARTTALGKYLSSFSKYMQQEPEINYKRKGASSSRKKLHILYVLHDVAHHTKHHTSNLSVFSTFTASIQPYLIELFQSAASDLHARVLSRLNDLLEAWEIEEFYSKDYINKLARVITGTNTLEQDAGESDSTAQPTQRETNEAAFIMPATHGDSATPYYDLPAGNLLPFLEPGSSAPIPAEQIKPLRFTAGPADKPLINALKEFMKDVESMEHKYRLSEEETGSSEIDELGQITIRDEAGDIAGDTYYGWSQAFCERMKRRRKGLGGDDSQHRSPSSQSSSRSPKKRRRYSDSERSQSPSRSRSPPRFRAASPPNARKDQGRGQPAQVFRAFKGDQHGPPPPRPSLRPNMPSNPVLFQAPPLGPDGLPIPPRPPANWNGPWPPPPPNVGVSFPPSHLHRNINFLPAPPPPPPSKYQDTYGGNYR